MEAEIEAKRADKENRTQNMFVARSGGGAENIPSKEEMAKPSKDLLPYEKMFI